MDSVPECCLDGWVRLQCQQPANVTEARWRQAIDDAGRFFDQWGGLVEKPQPILARRSRLPSLTATVSLRRRLTILRPRSSPRLDKTNPRSSQFSARRCGPKTSATINGWPPSWTLHGSAIGFSQQRTNSQADRRAGWRGARLDKLQCGVQVNVMRVAGLPDGCDSV